MKKIPFYFLLFLSPIPLSILAQQPNTNELDNIYTPDKNSLFNNSNSSGSSGSSDNSGYMTLAFKFNPGLLLRSTAAVFTQYWPSDDIGLEGGLGYCYSKDRLMSIVYDSDFNFSSPGSSLSLEKILEMGYSVSGPNIFTAFSTRFYWDNYYNENIYYFELASRYYVNSLLIKGNRLDTSNYDYDEYYIKGNPRVSVRNWVFNVNYGLQFITSGTVRTTHDFYIGFGIRNTSYNIFKFDEVTFNSGYGQSSVYVHEKSELRERVVVPVFMLGYVFGLGY